MSASTCGARGFSVFRSLEVSVVPILEAEMYGLYAGGEQFIRATEGPLSEVSLYK